MTKIKRNFLIFKEGHVLIGRRMNLPQIWEIISGDKRAGEDDPLETLKRVFGKTSIPEGIEVEMVIRSNGNEYVICHFYDFEIEGEESYPPIPLKYDKLMWVSTNMAYLGNVKAIRGGDLKVLKYLEHKIIKAPN